MFTRNRPRVVDPDKLTKLGTARGSTFVSLGSDEYIQAGEVATPDAAGPGEVLVKVPTTLADADGHKMEVGHTYRRLLPVEVGTFDRLRQRAAQAPPCSRSTRSSCPSWPPARR